MRATILILVLAAAVPAAAVDLSKEAATAAANPVRKVVTMLQMMQAKVEAEGEKEKALFDKFMCYCKNGGEDLKASIDGANTKIPALGSDIKAAQEQKTQNDEDLKTAQADRSAAKAAVKAATAVREKEAAAFASFKSDSLTNIAALNKAVAALEKGMAGGFLQTGAAQVLRSFVAKQDMADSDRDTVMAFLSGTQGSEYSPSSGEITGILKQLGDEMEASLAAATKTEEAAIATYEELMAAKNREVDVLTKSIEVKTKRGGELAVSIVQMQNDLGDTQEALMADTKFLENLETDCKTKSDEWDERVKTRTAELTALADTIKILNDDDALELFKKTLPGASASFVQVNVGASTQRARALATIREAQRKFPSSRPKLDFIALAIQGKKIGFGKVIKMIDDMVATLENEQTDDDNKKEYCTTALDTADDKKKSLEKSISDLEASIADTQEGITTTTEEIAALNKGIKDLDKSVAEATQQRKEESDDFTELMASDSAAVELLGMAKNRLNKFYNPKLYKPPAKAELARDDRIVANMGGAAVLVQVSAHRQHKDAPPPPPETFGAYSTKSEESAGVIEMVDLLVKDLEKEMTEAKTAEKDAQADYETMMQDSAQKRATDSKTLTDKTATKASLDSDLEMSKEDKSATGKELMATLQYISSLHTECDWLMKYFDIRKEARAGEMDALKSAKAVLSGADFSLVQTRHLRASQRA